MTDPKELADKIRKKGFRMPEDVQPTLEALDSYARILAASPDVREIEKTHALNLTYAESDVWVAQVLGHVTALLDVVRRKDAEIARLTAERDQAQAKIRDLRLWAEDRATQMTGWDTGDAWKKFPLARDDYGPYCPVCLAGPGRVLTEHSQGCEWLLLFRQAEPGK